MKRSLVIQLVLIMIFNSQNSVAAAGKSTLADEGAMPELDGAVGWLNSPPLFIGPRRGVAAQRGCAIA